MASSSSVSSSSLPLGALASVTVALELLQSTISQTTSLEDAVQKHRLNQVVVHALSVLQGVKSSELEGISKDIWALKLTMNCEGSPNYVSSVSGRMATVTEKILSLNKKSSPASEISPKVESSPAKPPRKADSELEMIDMLLHQGHLSAARKKIEKLPTLETRQHYEAILEAIQEPQKSQGSFSASSSSSSASASSSPSCIPFIMELLDQERFDDALGIVNKWIPPHARQEFLTQIETRRKESLASKSEEGAKEKSAEFDIQGKAVSAKEYLEFLEENVKLYIRRMIEEQSSMKVKLLLLKGFSHSLQSVHQFVADEIESMNAAAFSFLSTTPLSRSSETSTFSPAASPSPSSSSSASFSSVLSPFSSMTPTADFGHLGPSFPPMPLARSKSDPRSLPNPAPLSLSSSESSASSSASSSVSSSSSASSSSSSSSSASASSSILSNDD